MYSGIANIYYRKTVGHVFTKPVRIEGKTQKFTETGCLCKQKSSCRPLLSEDDVERGSDQFSAQSEEINGNCSCGAVDVENNSVWRSA